MHDAPILSGPPSIADQLYEVKRKLQQNDPMGALQALLVVLEDAQGSETALSALTSVREALTAESHRGDAAATELVSLLGSLTLNSDGASHSMEMDQDVLGSTKSIVGDTEAALAAAEGISARCPRCGGWVRASRMEAHERHWCPSLPL